MIKIKFKRHYRVVHFTQEIGEYINSELAIFIDEHYRYHTDDVGFVHCYHPKIFPEISTEKYPDSDIASFSILKLDCLNELSFDIAVVHSCEYPFLTKEVIQRGKPLVYVIHSLETVMPFILKEQNSLRQLFENLSGKAAAIVCISQAEKEKLVSVYPEWSSKTWVIYNGITIKENSLAEKPIRAKRNVFGYLGRIELSKGPLECVKAFRNLDAELRIASDVNLSSYFLALKNYIEAADIKEKIHFYGWCQGKRKINFLRSLDALIIPSLCEAFGYVVLEAMEIKIPIICSNCGGIQEITGEYQYTFDPYQPGELQRCIQHFQRDSIAKIQHEVDTLYSRLKNFSSEKMIAQYGRLYDAVFLRNAEDKF